MELSPCFHQAAEINFSRERRILLRGSKTVPDQWREKTEKPKKKEEKDEGQSGHTEKTEERMWM